LSIISIALMVERWMYFYRTRIDSDDLAAKLDEQLRARNLQGAWQLVKDTHTQSIESAVVAAGLIALRNGAHAASEAMLSVKARMRPALDANLSVLATIGNNAPFVGLLGTVLGIINAAHELTADTTSNNPNAVMSGVFEALVATAVGLFVAIPAVVAYNLFQRSVRKRIADVDSLAHLILATARSEGKPAAGPGAPAPAPSRVG
jgi:biopolymer transport protein ExbB